VPLVEGGHGFLVARVTPGRPPSPPRTAFTFPPTPARIPLMPIYEFTCEKCKERFELLVRAGTTKAPCPACGSKQVRRRFSTFGIGGGGGASKGSGSGKSSCSRSSCSGCKGCH